MLASSLQPACCLPALGRLPHALVSPPPPRQVADLQQRLDVAQAAATEAAGNDAKLKRQAQTVAELAAARSKLVTTESRLAKLQDRHSALQKQYQEAQRTAAEWEAAGVRRQVRRGRSRAGICVYVLGVQAATCADKRHVHATAVFCWHSQASRTDLHCSFRLQPCRSRPRLSWRRLGSGWKPLRRWCVLVAVLLFCGGVAGAGLAACCPRLPDHCMLSAGFHTTPARCQLPAAEHGDG